jgi:NAD(P)-dependent dehydrogenase (short-subunit alcohol dehydrogenase family)
MNHLALTLNVEEPLITCIAIRPGAVDTAMQQAIRVEHSGEMDQKDKEKFASLHAQGRLLKPEQPGHVMAKLALSVPRELGGKFLKSVTWFQISYLGRHMIVIVI